MALHVREIFQVSPGAGAPTVYKVETPVEPGELVPENNARSTLVQPPTRPRRVLLIEGAPGFEHGFLKRAWASDRGLEVDSVVRKGKNEQGADTFYIQATQSRGEQLRDGYPANREALFRYDALVFANVEGHQLSKAELELTRSFVGERGGGLLVLGARSFARQGLGGTRHRGRACRSISPIAAATCCRPRRYVASTASRSPRQARHIRSCSCRRGLTRLASDGKPCRRWRR